MKNIKNYFNTFLKGLLAGLCIAIGGWLYIKTRDAGSSSVLAAFLFPIGLILICNFGYFLYTGKICYLINHIKNKNGGSYIVHLAFGLIGNYVAATLIGLLLKNMFNVPSFVNAMVETKMGYEWWKLIILGIFCGILIYLAVEAFANIENIFGKYVILILCVAGFIICGFEHCIADMFYFAVGGLFSIKSLGVLSLIVLGNSLGGLLIPIVRRIINE